MSRANRPDGTTEQPCPPAPPAAPSSERRVAPPDPAAVSRIVAAALAEDLSRGDATSEGLFRPEEIGEMVLLIKQPGVLCGLGVLESVFAALDPGVVVTTSHRDGERIEEVPAEIARLSGPIRSLLAGERTALNLVARLSGIATEAARCVAEVQGTGATILDTRKTTPGLRDLEKYAVRCGGASNHRRDLGEALLVKDNHLRLAGGITAAVAKLKEARTRLCLEVEATTLDEVRQALDAGVNRILLDNMSIEQLRRAVALCREVSGDAVETEASGGVTLANLRQVAETGVDYISMGALTHSSDSLDFSLETVA